MVDERGIQTTVNPILEMALKSEAGAEILLLSEKLIVTEVNSEKKVFKRLTGEAVLDIARTICMFRGDCTSLQVKEALRANGYWATCDAVSTSMKYFGTEMGLFNTSYINHHSLNTFRVYTLKEKVEADVVALSNVLVDSEAAPEA